MTPTVTSVNDAAADTLLVAQNGNRRELLIRNDSTAVLYVLYGSGVASSSNYTLALGAGELLSTNYDGVVRGIWSADTASGAAKVTELA